MKIRLPETMDEWKALDAKMNLLAADPARLKKVYRAFAPESLYFMFRYVMSTRDWTMKDGTRVADHPFILDYCNRIEEEYHRVLDIGARGHFKSTIKTRILPTQFLIKDPNFAICIFSFARKAAKSHLLGLKREYETNTVLKTMWPEIFYPKPATQSESWTVENGLVVRRTSSRMEASLEAHAFEDNQPVGKHYNVLLFDDCETRDSVTTQQQRAKSVEAHDLAMNIVSKMDKVDLIYTGTYYHHNGLWKHLEKEGKVKVRLTPAVDESKPAPKDYPHIGGEPVFLDAEDLQEEYEVKGPRVYAQQMLCKATHKDEDHLDHNKIITSHLSPAKLAAGCNIYICVDPGSGKSELTDPTAMVVVGLGADRRYRILDVYRKRMNPGERIDNLFSLHARWKNVGEVKEVRWEETSMQSDVFHIQTAMKTRNYFLNISRIPQNTRGGSKQERIMDRLYQPLSKGEIVAPTEIMKKGSNGHFVDTLQLLRDEMSEFPLGSDDHILDALSLMFEPDRTMPGGRKQVNPLQWPRLRRRRVFEPTRQSSNETTWMTQ